MAEAPQIAVVTGGASGIGEAVCRELASTGLRLVVVDRDLARSQSVAEAVGGAAFQCDVADASDVRRLADAVEAEVGTPSILVNSAGVFQRPLRPEDDDVAIWDEIVAVNQRGTYVCCVEFGRRMIQRGGGSIVNVASIAAGASMPLHAYAPSKAAVVSITRCLAGEWGRSGVRVNAVSPGYTLTPSLEDAIAKGERSVDHLQNSALGRIAKPDEIAKVIAFLAGPQSSIITGVDLVADCGWLLAQTWNPYGGVRQSTR